MNFNQLGDFLGSKAFENTAKVGGTLLSSLGQGKQQEAEREASERNNARSILINLLESRRNDTRNRAVSAADASPLGDEQQFEARARIARQMLGGARNVNFRPMDPEVAAYFQDPSTTGGMRVPEGGFDTSAYSDGMVKSAIDARRAKVNAIATPPVDTKTDELEALLRQALDGDMAGAAQPQPKKSGGMSKFLKYALPIASLAAIPFTGGLSAAGMAAAAAPPAADLMQTALRRRQSNVRF